MNKIILVLAIVSIGIFGAVTDIFAQKELQNEMDSMIIGGIYKVLLLNGKDITGELTGKSESIIILRTNKKVYRFEKNQIKSIVAGKTYYSVRNIEYDEYDYLNYFCTIQTGVEIPDGDFGVVHDAGFGLQVSLYTLLNRYAGIGGELQYNYFPGTEINFMYYNYYSNSYDMFKKQSDNFHLYTLKLNLIAGNLKLENKLVFYGLAGAAFQYYEPWGEMTYSYGGGCGAIYKISKNTGINCELQYNRLPPEENIQHYGSWNYIGSVDEFDGCFSIRIGVMFMGL